jgi:bifunctional non-homologous end joining protein LigD
LRPGIPAAMLARPGRVPTGPGWLFEVKFDGFRAIVCTRDGLRVRSRRRWDMTSFLPELAGLPDGLMLDGGLVAWEDGLPSFPRLCQRVLHGDRSIAITYLVFDLLHVDGASAMCLPYEQRRTVLETLDLRGPAWHVPIAFEDGEALFKVVCERGLEGVVAKRRTDSYRPGERQWIKTKNPTYWRLGQERERWSPRAAARHGVMSREWRGTGGNFVAGRPQSGRE